MTERKTTSIKVEPQLWKEFKKLAIDKDKDISDMLEQMIKEKVNSR